MGQIANGSDPVLANDVNVVLEIGRRLSYEMLGNTKKNEGFLLQRLHHVPLGAGLLSLFQPCLVEN